MDALVGGVKGDLGAVQGGVPELLAVFRRQADAVGVQAGDEPAGVGDELRQVLPQGGLPAGEGHLGDAGGAAAVQDGLPFLGRKLRFLRAGLARGVAVDAFLVAVPASVPGHGTHQQVHPVGGAHLGRVFLEREEADGRLRLLPPGDLGEGVHDGVDVLLHPLPPHQGIDLLHTVAGILHDLRRFLVIHGLPGVFIHASDEFRQQDAPGGVHRDHVLPVEDGDAGGDLLILHQRRHQVDAHHPRPLRVQGGVVDFVEILSGIGQLPLACAHRNTSLFGVVPLSIAAQGRFCKGETMDALIVFSQGPRPLLCIPKHPSSVASRQLPPREAKALASTPSRRSGLPSPWGRWQPPSPARRMADEGDYCQAFQS